MCLNGFYDMFPIMGIEAKQPMDQAMDRTKNIHCKGGKEAKKLAKEHEVRKAQAIKLLKNAHATYDKQASKL